MRYRRGGCGARRRGNTALTHATLVLGRLSLIAVGVDATFRKVVGAAAAENQEGPAVVYGSDLWHWRQKLGVIVRCGDFRWCLLYSLWDGSGL